MIKIRTKKKKKNQSSSTFIRAVFLKINCAFFNTATYAYKIVTSPYHLIN